MAYKKIMHICMGKSSMKCKGYVNMLLHLYNISWPHLLLKWVILWHGMAKPDTMVLNDILLLRVVIIEKKIEQMK